MASNQYRIIVGSYDHNLMCLSLDLSSASEPLFTPIFHFQAHALSVKCLDVSKRYLVSGSNDEHIRIYDLQKRKELGTLLAHQGSITALKFSSGESNGKWMLSSSEDNKIIIWRVKDWENYGVLKGHLKRVNDIAIHPSSRVAVSVSDDHSIRLWNLMTMKKAAVLKLRKYDQNGQFVRWTDNGDHFAVALMTKLLIFSTANAKVHFEVDISKKTIMHLETVKLGDEDREYLVVGLSDGNVQFYPVDELIKEEPTITEPEFSLLGHSNRIKDFKFYPNDFGTYLITIGSDGRIVVWDMKTKDQVAVYDCGERLNCLAVCDESVEKYETVRKRGLEDVEQSEAEVSDTEELKKVMFGDKKKKKKTGKKSKNAKTRKYRSSLNSVRKDFPFN
ncbi:Mak11p KNAG_0H00180 [Huiozyma naganishii CBS 8797]|uniref:Uncharacterized protein n=1 Tax=Huiozyma naganishii (strain ATCC MYA-139 / BCRC 22969 / CBS 8797 / KCTC 17520 / NBRC 10181 / NCYC 3082 / Yp74L-3) TaxID=1071383 RepID=J7S897_HUIN7|nr:hypothetical protein KNAG_0H00180 [Kazachstania naganishii CBS 8797]CCK71434.1 hypothetical protein KNAG_0H00180 [Kazachstania naganishii CBS 8797]